MRWTAWSTLAALAMYFWVFAQAGRVRARLKIKAPSMDGPVEFQNAIRVQANTVEQLVLFLPLLWLCAVFLGDRWAAAGGALWTIGRILYALGYYRDASRRGPGFGISLLATAALGVGAVIGLLLH